MTRVTSTDENAWASERHRAVGTVNHQGERKKLERYAAKSLRDDFLPAIMLRLQGLLADRDYGFVRTATRCFFSWLKGYDPRLGMCSGSTQAKTMIVILDLVVEHRWRT